MTGIALLVLEFTLSVAILLLGLATMITMPAGATVVVLVAKAGRYGTSAVAFAVMTVNAVSLLGLSSFLHALRGPQ